MTIQRRKVGKGLVTMRVIRFSILLCCVSLLLISCGGSMDPGSSGFIIMMPYINQEMGIRGVVPLNWDEVEDGQFVRRNSQLDETTIILTSIPNTSMEKAKAYASSQLGLERLPDNLGTYSSPALTWELYEFEATASEVLKMKMHLALAEGDRDVYAVLVAAHIDDSQSETPFSETLFVHAVHAFSPLD